MKNTLLIFAVLLTLLSCNAKTENSSTQKEVIINQDAVVRVDLSVKGMTCTGCENTVKKGVSELPGVLDVSASFQDGRAVVKFDTTLTNPGKISEAITKSGYQVTGQVRTE